MSPQNEGKGFASNPKLASEAGKKGGKASSKTTSKQGGSSKGGQRS